jgi:translation initiation factor IF-2
MADEMKIGHVSHYFGKILVAAIDLTDGDLKIGDTIHIKGHTSDFIEEITSMQIDKASVDHAEKGQSIGIRVKEHARVGDEVFKVTQ